MNRNPTITALAETRDAAQKAAKGADLIRDIARQWPDISRRLDALETALKQEREAVGSLPDLAGQLHDAITAARAVQTSVSEVEADRRRLETDRRRLSWGLVAAGVAAVVLVSAGLGGYVVHEFLTRPLPRQIITKPVCDFLGGRWGKDNNGRVFCVFWGE